MKVVPMKRLVLALLAALAPTTAAADALRSFDEVAAPQVLAGRPTSDRVWEDVGPSRLRAANTNKIFLNRCVGGCLVNRGTTDSRTNTTTILRNANQTTLTAFSRSDTVWNNVVSCVRDVFGPFGVEILTDDPGTASHFEIMIAGTPQQLGRSAGVGGVSPYNCAVEYIPNSLVFVFDVWGDSVEDICSTAAQELAHSFGLDHVTDPSDPLTYFNYSGRRRFKDAQVQCGSDCVDADNNPATANTGPFGQVCSGTGLQGEQNHTCTCNDGPHADILTNTQNSVAVMRSLFGAGVPTPPTLAIAKPRAGDNVAPGFPVVAEATDDNGIGSVELHVDGALAGTVTQIPYVFNAPATLADGSHTVEVIAFDRNGASTTRTVQVYIGPPCTKPAECPSDTDTCVGGRCVPGPGVQGGLGTACTENLGCASGQCAANSTGEMYCVEPCDPANDQCPGGFACLTVGAGGVCWPSEDSGGCSTTGGGPFVLGLALIALFVTTSRAGRRRRPRR